MSEGVFRPRGHDTSEHASGHAAYLDSLEEAVNRQIDTDVKALMDNFKEIINLSRIGGKDHYDMNRESFVMETRADSMVRATQSLYLLSDALKLSLLLSQSQMSEVRDQEANDLLAQTEKHKQECSRLLAERWLTGAALAGKDPPSSSIQEPQTSHTNDMEEEPIL